MEMSTTGFTNPSKVQKCPYTWRLFPIFNNQLPTILEKSALAGQLVSPQEPGKHRP